LSEVRSAEAPTTPCPGDGVARPRRRSSAARWRVATLLAVHVLIALHIAHWLGTGRGETLSPIEPSESMYFLERGELNAGVIFFATTLLLTAIFGRFFCGWACHVVALQDLCAGIMKRCGVRPRLFRSRLLMYVPLIIGVEMFILPVFKRQVLGRLVDNVDARLWFDGMHPVPGFVPAWEFSNELMTEGFWDTFVGPWMAIPFLLICGFAVVYFLGAKGFCTYGCPYGAFFAGMDRLAPGRIVADLDLCQKCGECTAHCTSNVRIHEEIQDWGKVVSAGCMKCFDCVSVCPTGALRFGFSKPRLLSRPLEGRTPRARRYDLDGREELLLFLLFFWLRYSWRGVFHAIPMLMATGIAGCLIFLVWKSLRLRRSRDVSLHRFALRRGGETTSAGRAVAALSLLSLLLTAGLCVTKWNQEQAEWNYRRLEARQANLDQALAIGAPPFPEEVRRIAERGAGQQARLRTFPAGGLSLLPQPTALPTEPRLGYFRAVAGDLAGAKEAWERALRSIDEVELEARYAQLIDRLGYAAYESGGAKATIPIIEEGLVHLPDSPFLAHRLGLLYAEVGDAAEAERWKARADALQAEALRRASAPAPTVAPSDDPARSP